MNTKDKTQKSIVLEVQSLKHTLKIETIANKKKEK